MQAKCFENEVVIFWDLPKDYNNDNYIIYQDGTKIGETKKTHFSIKNLNEDTYYTFSVTKEHESGFSKEIKVKTLKSKNFIDVTKAPYNCVGDGISMNTIGLQCAIDDCGENDCVYVPDGRFLTGALTLHSNMELRLADDAVIIGSTSIADYMPKKLSRSEGTEMDCYQSLLNIGEMDHSKGYTIENVLICGGRIVGGGIELFNDTLRCETGVEKNDLLAAKRSRGRLIQVANAKNCTICNSTIENSNFWSVHCIYSTDVAIFNCLVKTSGVENGDGIDLDSTTNSVVFNCRFNTSDDALAIKSGKNPEGNAIGRPSENIKIFDVVSEDSHGLAIGSEMSGGVENIFMWDCDLTNSTEGIQLKTSRKRGGYIKNIFVNYSRASKLSLREVYYNSDGDSAGVPVIADIYFADLILTGVSHWYMDKQTVTYVNPIWIDGFDNNLSNVKLKNIYIENVFDETLQEIVVKNESQVSIENLVQNKNIKQYSIRRKIEDGEYWFPGVVDFSDFIDPNVNKYTHKLERVPFSTSSYVNHNVERTNYYNQVSSILLSNTGRVIYGEELSFQVYDGYLFVSSKKDSIINIKAGESLREAYNYAMKHFFKVDGITPPKDFFEYPVYNDWMAVGYNQNQEDILRYASEICESGYPYKIIMIDDKWSDYYGNFEFNKKRFPDAEKMIEELHAKGFILMLWETPYVSPDSPEYRYLAQKGLLVRDSDGQVAIRKWWNGHSAILDVSNPAACEWLKAQNARLINLGIDGFKFDGGDFDIFKIDDVNYANATPSEMCKCWSQFALNYSFNELRASFNMGGKALIQRQSDKSHSWKDKGIKNLVKFAIMQSLLGYAYLCPDMVGGGNLLEEEGFDSELFIRFCQCSALLPIMQFSKLPWKLLNDEENRICYKYVKLHCVFGGYIYALAKQFSLTGTPIIRPLDFEFPNQGYEQEMDMFMLGDKYLVAPILQKGQILKTIMLPKGCDWKYMMDGTVYRGGESVSIPVKLETLPYFEKI